ncbi:MAG: dihydroorotase [Rikenellaceae bacterium]|nr:dihydroorotase [Rikenellaceae bacterium]
MKILISGGTIVNEGVEHNGYLTIENGLIGEVALGDCPHSPESFDRHIDARDLIVMPGVIDDQVHFRDPGLTHKGDMHTESRAGVAGGVTSFMDMPNTTPPTVTLEALEAKYDHAAETAMSNHAFFFGATADNTHLFERLDPRRICGIKLFMGSSTGGLLVNDNDALDAIFASAPLILAVHCEDEALLRANMAAAKAQYGDDIPPAMHPVIRNSQVCFRSSARAVELAHKHGTRLHILHLSTAAELSLMERKPLDQKQITGEVCMHHLWFSSDDYARKGNLIKWNPAVKEDSDRQALLNALSDGLIDIAATDHAPHTLEEKSRPYLDAPSGAPMLQHSLAVMLEICRRNRLGYSFAADKMAHRVAQLFRIKGRGFLRKGYHADIAIVDPRADITVSSSNILYKCGWSPLEGTRLSHSVTHTIINGRIVYERGSFDESFRGMPLEFDR